jgi:hypothetical protein
MSKSPLWAMRPYSLVVCFWVEMRMLVIGQKYRPLEMCTSPYAACSGLRIITHTTHLVCVISCTECKMYSEFKNLRRKPTSDFCVSMNEKALHLIYSKISKQYNTGGHYNTPLKPCRSSEVDNWRLQRGPSRTWTPSANTSVTAPLPYRQFTYFSCWPHTANLPRWGFCNKTFACRVQGTCGEK